MSATAGRTPQVVLYTRAGCHLCEDAEAILRQAMAQLPFELRLVDIDNDQALAGRYGVRVPVVAIDGAEHFEYEVPPEELLHLLRSASSA